MTGLKIISTGYYVPKKVLDNHDFEEMVDTSDEWIVSRTGIKKRHFSEGESTADLGYLAALKAIENGKINKEEIGLIVVSTMTPDHFTPNTACLIQERLGLNDIEVMAFDLNSACSGFVYGMSVVKALLQDMKCKYALLIGSEVLSKLIDFKDRGTCILFGDGAGAVVVQKSDNLFVAYNDAGGKHDSLYADIFAEDSYLKMNGQEVFKFASTVIPLSINKVLNEANLTIDDIDYVVCHQANYRIIANVYKKMDCDASKFYMNLEEYGNTSAASIPLALAEMDEKGLLKKGMKIILVGFGGGLSWGATLIEW